MKGDLISKDLARTLNARAETATAYHRNATDSVAPRTARTAGALWIVREPRENAADRKVYVHDSMASGREWKSNVAVSKANADSRTMARVVKA